MIHIKLFHKFRHSILPLRYCACGSRYEVIEDDIDGSDEYVCPNCGRCFLRLSAPFASHPQIIELPNRKKQ